MASKNYRHGHYVPPSSASSASETDGSLSRGRKRTRRDANVYDAVAGRVTTTLPLEDAADAATSFARHRSRDTLRDPTLAPDEVLFRRARAPERFVEKDIYRAHEALPEAGRGVLPDGDLLQAVHAYASHFYAALAAGADERSMDETAGADERSMDETALLTFGVLLEEAAREALGRRGDLVFTEGVEVDEPGPAEGGGGGGGGASITSIAFLDGGRS